MIDYKEIIKKIIPELDKVVSFFEKELLKIRTGRISPALIEDISVECFGQKFPLKQLASISILDPKQLVISPWDKSYIEPIEKAVFSSNLGVSPIVEKDSIRISFPPISEEYKKNFLLIISEKQEEANKTIRKWREKAWEEIQEKTKEGEIKEDDKYRAKEELQEIVDEYNKKIKELSDKKRKEIMDN